MAKVLTLAALLVSLAAVPASAQAFHGRGCRTIKTSAYGGEAIRVVVSKGSAPCAEARKIATKFHSRHRGPERHYGKPEGLANAYWIIDGWECQTDTDGASGCARGTPAEIRSAHGARNLIDMQAFPPDQQQEAECKSELERFGKEWQPWCHETYAEKNGMTEAEYGAEVEKGNHKIEEEFTAACGPPKHSTKTIEGSAEVEGWIDSPEHRCPGAGE